jgi:hypothetical protein
MSDIVKWKDPQDLSSGFTVDLEQCSVKQLLQTIYQKPEQLLSAFSDCFLLMRYSPVEAQDMALELYNQTRLHVTNLLQRHIDSPFIQSPANTAVQH